MNKRRQFLKTALGFFAGLGFLSGTVLSAARWAYGEARKVILPKGTKRESLVQKDPKNLDSRNLEITDLKDFGTMGLSDQDVDSTTWRLEVGGHVKNPLSLTYPEILDLPAFERNVLLICPGFFANHGRWKGVSMGALLEKAGTEKGAVRVTFSGPKGSYEKVESFPIEDVLSNRVFLAYGVNGETLPKKHGFPLRVVAEGYYGDNWVKYVCKMTIEKR